MQAQEVLSRVFGHADFRAGQRTLVSAVLAGRDALGVMPTGGGKSICYQVPALMLEGVTLVISPLISLMSDQVAALVSAGVRAAYINSSLSASQYETVCARLLQGVYKIVYVAPERLRAPSFCALCKKIPISLVAVDEAHCISQWGQDFRPSYLQIADFIRELPNRPIVSAYTATATERVRQDIERLLALRDPERVLTGFDRENLFFDVRREKSKLSAVRAYIHAHADKSGVVYCATRRSVEQVCKALRAQGISAAQYHAGLSDAERSRAQEDFQFDRVRVMVATNAFGMGIDKSNVSFVLHYNMPKSMEAYYQEAGRAGRDGSQAECVLFFAPSDVVTARCLIALSEPNENLSEEEQAAVRAQDYARLEQMERYCLTQDCFRAAILDYFGQAHEQTCQNCGNCQNAVQQCDVTQEAQMALSCVRRIESSLGCGLGATTVAGVLRGAKNRAVLDRGLAKLPTYGLLKRQSADDVRALLDGLLMQGYLLRDTYGALHVSPRAHAVLFANERVFLRTHIAQTSKSEMFDDQTRAILEAAAGLSKDLSFVLFTRFLRGSRDKRLLEAGLDRAKGYGCCRELSREQTQALVSACKQLGYLSISSQSAPVRVTKKALDALQLQSAQTQLHDTRALLDRLKKARLQEAMRQRVPAYVVFSDATLSDMARKMPRDEADFKRVSGVGDVKARRYADLFLSVIREFADETSGETDE